MNNFQTIYYFNFNNYVLLYGNTQIYQHIYKTLKFINLQNKTLYNGEIPIFDYVDPDIIPDIINDSIKSNTIQVFNDIEKNCIYIDVLYHNYSKVRKLYFILSLNNEYISETILTQLKLNPSFTFSTQITNQPNQPNSTNQLNLVYSLNTPLNTPLNAQPNEYIDPIIKMPSIDLYDLWAFIKTYYPDIPCHIYPEYKSIIYINGMCFTNNKYMLYSHINDLSSPNTIIKTYLSMKYCYNIDLSGLINYKNKKILYEFISNVDKKNIFSVNKKNIILNDTIIQKYPIDGGLIKMYDIIDYDNW